MHTTTGLATLAATSLIAATVIVSTAAAATLPVPGIIIPWPTPPGTPTHPHSMVLECRVKDSNFWIMNFGSKVMETGLQITWDSPATGDSGEILLPKRLEPGDEVKLADVLSSDAAAGSPCTAALA